LALGGTAAVVLLTLSAPRHIWDFLFIVLFAVTILSLSLAVGPARLIFGHPILIYLGRVSYSLYLVHAVVLTVLHRPAQHFLPRGPLGAALGWIIYLVVAIGAAHLLFSAVEEPARTWARRRLDREPTTEMAPGAA
jgi:peptidoglycan/LPS O-acetylase OafA/YrhL